MPIDPANLAIGIAIRQPGFGLLGATKRPSYGAPSEDADGPTAERNRMLEEDRVNFKTVPIADLPIVYCKYRDSSDKRTEQAEKALAAPFVAPCGVKIGASKYSQIVETLLELNPTELSDTAWAKLSKLSPQDTFALYETQLRQGFRFDLNQVSRLAPFLALSKVTQVRKQAPQISNEVVPPVAPSATGDMDM